MHYIYQTEGLVLKSVDFGEANKYLFVFTKEFGLIKVAAQGLRNVKSKLRYGLQEFSIARLSMVQGRNVWRVINSVCDKNLCFSLSEDKQKLIVIKHILDLLMQLLSGEEKNEELYLTIREAFSFLEKNDFKDTDIKSFENIIVVRILYCLGYFDKKKKVNNKVSYSFFLNLNEWNKNLLNKMQEDITKQQVIFDINTSLQSSQLI